MYIIVLVILTIRLVYSDEYFISILAGLPGFSRDSFSIIMSKRAFHFIFI